MLSTSKPAICQHAALKLHSDIYGTYVQTRAKCHECGTKIVVRFPASIMFTQTGLAPLPEIERRIRRLMSTAIRMKIPADKIIAVRPS